MRQIKFRGKRIDNSEWVYGYYRAVKYIGHGKMIKGKTEKIQSHKHEIAEDGWNWSEVDPETIGQFTGLHDKNGKDIFEGDEVEYDYLYSEFEMPFGTGHWEWQRACDFVEYQGDGFCLENECMPLCAVLDMAESMKEAYPTDIEYESGIEVIGNIHENPELCTQQ